MEKKSFLKKIKEMWKDPKGKALIKLCLYCLFMVSIIVFANISSMLNGDKRRVITNEKTLDNYEYNSVITIDNNIFNIEGIRYKDKENINILETKENVNIENNITLKNSFLNNLDFINLRLDNIKNILDNSQSIKTITYNDGSEKIEYLITSEQLNLLKNKNIVVSNINIKIVKYVKNNDIYKLEIDASELFKLINSKLNKYLIVIEYENIGNINNFNAS